MASREHRKLLPASIGSYQQISPSNLTAEQLAVLKSVSKERVLHRLMVLVGDGRVSVSVVQSRYGALMSKVGHA